MRISSSALRTHAAFALCACSFAVSRAEGTDLAGVQVEASNASFGRASIDASSEAEPRTGFVNVQAGNSDDLFASPRWISSTEISGGVHRWSLSRGVVDIGVHVPAAAGRGAEFRSEPAIGPANFVLPAFSIGLKQPEAAAQTASSLLARAGGTRAELSASRVGVEWKPAQSQVNFLREGLGFRLDGSDRMTVRLRKGVLGVYMHRKF